MAYYSYMLGISTNFDLLYMIHLPQNAFHSMRVRYIHAATTLVREFIDLMPPRPAEGDVPDELIGSILALSCCHVVNVQTTDHPTSRFASPLARAQCLDMLSAIPFLESHRLALVKLVTIKGGLEAFVSNHLAALVQL
jgi:hypothetical protein